MNAHQQETATLNNGGGGASSTTFITSTSLSGTLRNDGGSYYTGFQFTIGGAGITVTHLGRYKTSGDSAVHDVQLFSAGTPISGGNVSVDMSLTPDADGYVYAALATPQALSASGVYQIGSREINGVDHFYEYSSSLTSTGVATMNSSFYYLSGTSGNVGGPGTSYGPTSFKYT